MRRTGCKCVVVLASVVLTLASSSAQAIVLYSQPDRNMSAPVGKLASSGWQWQGQFGSFLGTPIAPNYSITAGHVGGVPGQPFFFNGHSYNTVAYYDDPASDLRIWKIDGAFPTRRRYSRNTPKLAGAAMIFGRGTQRGDPVFVGGELKGWEWGSQDGLQKLGAATRSPASLMAASKRGDMLYFTFDQSGVAQEGTLSAGDSGGALFVKQGAAWKLAGINTSVDGPYAQRRRNRLQRRPLRSRRPVRPRLQRREAHHRHAQDYPAAAYATRISTNLPWITDVLAGASRPAEQPSESSAASPSPRAQSSRCSDSARGCLGADAPAPPNEPSSAYHDAGV